MGEFVKVAVTGEVPPGQAKTVEINGQEIALFNIDGTFHAIENACTHVGGPLAEGTIDGCEVTCPWHGAVFDVTSGQVIGPPAAQPVSRYSVRVTGDAVEIEVPF